MFNPRTPLRPRTGGGAGASKNAAAAGLFQGVLVQKIDAAETTGSAGNAASNPMAGLLGMLTAVLGATPADSNGEETAAGQKELSELLNGLEDKLAQVEQEAQPSDSLLQKMAELLASLQALLQQNAGQAAMGSAVSDDSQGGVAANAPLAEQVQASIIVPALRDVIQSLRSMMQSGQLSTAAAAEAVTGIRQVLQTEQPGPSTIKTDRKTAGTTQGSTAVQTAEPDAKSVEAAVSHTEVKRSFPVFKEPVVYWNLHASSAQGEAVSAEQAAIADAAAEAEQQPVALNWQQIASDAGVKPDGGIGAKQQPQVTVPASQFAEQMDKFLVKQFKLTSGNGISEANINLRPEHLGEVQIRLTIQNGVLNAQFVAHNEAAKELLENQMAQLRGSLQNQGIQVDRVEVVQQQPQTAADSPSFMNQEQRRQQSQGEGEAKRSTDGAQTLEDFEEELERSATLREAGFGGSLNVKA
ncbi:flagellar hook-length control protein FliK [Cohnella rhizosphaerae]|uniref:Flagellar hook-length control protein FliK n=1 Tax=Cohnella rhizosphaerae TaxID=1457232 RepID=A0A9X4QVG7_9BACL|nr:flagellar hook-length control protein FliK [Cohnella rhizosphaerae]MDG0812428.1 flagellar hook-length control protein FliK [Cohnella rhizosphaerae]